MKIVIVSISSERVAHLEKELTGALIRTRIQFLDATKASAFMPDSALT
ncbi:MAG: hypothetical protein M3P47_01945 [Pseudomonadota bacterium]|nr:hypothetical protein [Pseudomonadota bacterium]